MFKILSGVCFSISKSFAEKLNDFKNGAEIERYDKVLGYNGGMKKYRKLEENLLLNMKSFDATDKITAVETFKYLWVSEKDYAKHYHKRHITENVITGEYDYIEKTLIH